MRNVYIVRRTTTSNTKITAFSSYKKAEKALLDMLEVRMNQNKTLTEKDKIVNRINAEKNGRYFIHFPTKNNSKKFTVEIGEIVPLPIQ